MRTACSITLSTLATAFFCCGCSTAPAECDPSRADFFSNTACLASGTYATRESRLERELAREQRINRDFYAVLAALEQEQVSVRSRLRASEARYADLDRAWDDLQASLRQGYGENRELARRIDVIDRELAQRKAGSGTEDVRRKERLRSDLRRDLSLLQQELEAGIYE
jgi:chromosome segregation ATPase